MSDSLFESMFLTACVESMRKHGASKTLTLGHLVNLIAIVKRCESCEEVRDAIQYAGADDRD